MDLRKMAPFETMGHGNVRLLAFRRAARRMLVCGTLCVNGIWGLPIKTCFNAMSSVVLLIQWPQSSMILGWQCVHKCNSSGPDLHLISRLVGKMMTSMSMAVRR